jgi:hypothetical protein
MSYGRDYHLGAKIFLAVLLALFVGYLWACFETGRSPLALLRLFSGKEPEVATPPAPPKKAPPKAPEPVRPKDPTPPPPAPVAKPVEPAPVPPAPKVYSAVEMNSLFLHLDQLIRKGRFFEALTKLENTSRSLVPQDQTGRFFEYEARIKKYSDLLRETTKEVTIDMPALTRLLLKAGGRLVVKILNEDKTSVFYETITGIRSRTLVADLESREVLSPIYASVEVKNELIKKCGYAGLDVVNEPGKPLVYTEKPGRTVTGLQFFDLADFCARNGANEHLTGLFDGAMKREPELLGAVHELKADRMVDVFMYFLTMKYPSDARAALDQLQKRYADTKAYRERVATDPDIQTAMELTFRKPVKLTEPVAKIEPRRSSPPPASAEPGTAETKTPDPAAGAPPDPPPAVERSSEPETAAHPTTVRMPDGTTGKVQDLVAKGDRYYDEAMRHLQNSDSRGNPDGWAEENRKALALFMKAMGEAYQPAQDLYSGSVPTQLLDRFRETQMRIALCRKRSVRH